MGAQSGADGANDTAGRRTLGAKPPLPTTALAWHLVFLLRGLAFPLSKRHPWAWKDGRGSKEKSVASLSLRQCLRASLRRSLGGCKLRPYLPSRHLPREGRAVSSAALRYKPGHRTCCLR